jgi:hypothetical protein
VDVAFAVAARIGVVGGYVLAETAGIPRDAPVVAREELRRAGDTNLARRIVGEGEGPIGPVEG